MHIEVDENQSDRSLAIGAQVGKTGGMIMAALVYSSEGGSNSGVHYITPAVARKCREAALVLHGVEEDEPGEE